MLIKCYLMLVSAGAVIKLCTFAKTPIWIIQVKGAGIVYFETLNPGACKEILIVLLGLDSIHTSRLGTIALTSTSNFVA